ncbi:Zn-ribbon domain-containing OB-fold protein [Patescibacteria group bacterium]|nr:Zn-ribbon domain-containing OB-fold protein [Patescibacteria group bacterium]
MSIIQNWRLYESRYNLVGSVCRTCGKQYFPKSSFCSKCGSDKLTDETFSKEGTVYSFSKVNVSPYLFQKQTPYVVALIKLKNGPLITSQIVDSEAEKIKIGQKVKAVFRKISDEKKGEIISYGIKFRLL